MEYLVQARNKKIKAYFEHILPNMIAQLGLTNCRKALLVTVEADCEHSGLTVPMPGIDSFVVVVNAGQSLKELGLTLAHELVHVRQMAKGILKTVRGGHTWAGKKYPLKTKYYDRPWELDAFARQEIIFRRAVCAEE